jgi:hypothetical protein
MKVCLTKGEFQERCSDVFFSFKADQYKVEQHRNDLFCEPKVARTGKYVCDNFALPFFRCSNDFITQKVYFSPLMQVHVCKYKYIQIIYFLHFIAVHKYSLDKYKNNSSFTQIL